MDEFFELLGKVLPINVGNKWPRQSIWKSILEWIIVLILMVGGIALALWLTDKYPWILQ